MNVALSCECDLLNTKGSMLIGYVKRCIINYGYNWRMAKTGASTLTEITQVDVFAQGCLSNELRSRIFKEDQTLTQIEALGAMIESVEEQVKSLYNLQSSGENVYRIEERKIGGRNFESSVEKIDRTGNNQNT